MDDMDNDFGNSVNSFGNSVRDLGDKAGNVLTDGVNTAAKTIVDTMANSVSSSASPAITTGVGTTPVRTSSNYDKTSFLRITLGGF